MELVTCCGCWRALPTRCIGPWLLTRLRWASKPLPQGFASNAVNQGTWHAVVQRVLLRLAGKWLQEFVTGATSLGIWLEIARRDFRGHLCLVWVLVLLLQDGVRNRTLAVPRVSGARNLGTSRGIAPNWRRWQNIFQLFVHSPRLHHPTRAVVCASDAGVQATWLAIVKRGLPARQVPMWCKRGAAVVFASNVAAPDTLPAFVRRLVQPQPPSS